MRSCGAVTDSDGNMGNPSVRHHHANTRWSAAASVHPSTCSRLSRDDCVRFCPGEKFQAKVQTGASKRNDFSVCND